MEEYYTLEVTVVRHRHPEGLPRHNDHHEAQIGDFKIRDSSLENLVQRGIKHIELIDE